MVFTHQLTVGTLMVVASSVGFTPSTLQASSRSGHAALAASYHRQIAADNRPKLRPALHHAQKLVKLGAGDPNSSAMTYSTARSFGCSEPSQTPPESGSPETYELSQNDQTDTAKLAHLFAQRVIV